MFSRMLARAGGRAAVPGLQSTCLGGQARWCLSKEVPLAELRAYQANVQNTLDAVCDVLDDLGDECDEIDDIVPTEGVLEVKLTDGGTYVLNKQEPRMQLWLSSPLSGPSQFTMFVKESGNLEWRDLDTDRELNSLLTAEFTQLLERSVSFNPVQAKSA